MACFPDPVGTAKRVQQKKRRRVSFRFGFTCHQGAKLGPDSPERVQLMIDLAGWKSI